MRKKLALNVLLILVTGLLLTSACAKAAKPPPTTPTPTAGEKLYTTYCGSCHGDKAQGTNLAPALGGHSEKVLIRQVRTPIGKMPAFPPSQISNEELEAIASFVASLPAPEHAEPLEMEEPVILHHWMALYALKEDDTEDAQHHLNHILERITDQEHRHGIEEAKELIKRGELHEAGHEVEEMLARKADPALPLTKLHLELSLAAIGIKDAKDALHHMEHFSTQATPADRLEAQKVINLLKAGDLHEAEHEIEEILATL